VSAVQLSKYTPRDNDFVGEEIQALVSFIDRRVSNKYIICGAWS
jgi:hypothetical protein